MTRPACRTCDHWASQSPKLPQGMGYCRINPPVCVAVDNEVRTVWPIVPGHSRCALYEPAEAYAAALRDRELAARLQEGQRVVTWSGERVTAVRIADGETLRVDGPQETIRP